MFKVCLETFPQEAGLVKHAPRPRPSGQQGPGLVKENVPPGIIYAAVKLQSPAPKAMMANKDSVNH